MSFQAGEAAGRSGAEPPAGLYGSYGSSSSSRAPSGRGGERAAPTGPGGEDDDDDVYGDKATGLLLTNRERPHGERSVVDLMLALGVRSAIVLTVILGVLLSCVVLVVTEAGHRGGAETSSSGSDEGTVYTSPAGVSVKAMGEAENYWALALPRSAINTNEAISFTLTRVGYDTIDLFAEDPSAILKYDHLSEYMGVVEPYQEMHLTVYDDEDSAVNKFRYTVCAADGGECQHGVKYDPDPGLSATISFECDAYDEFVINVTEYDSAGNELRSTTGFALCQYVRREIRTLSVDDLSATLDAMHTLWVIDEDDGQETYGDEYHSASYLLKSHHFNAAWPDGDHIHEGNGFMTQHVKMTNIFELSIQAVDPSVSLPYWDFTMDNTEGKTPYTSAVFEETVFGTMHQPRSMSMGFQAGEDDIVDGAIPDGRWAYLKADFNEDYDDLNYGYGYMRAPWNMNPSPYVSRFAYDYQIGISLPSCKTHYEILEYDSMMDFFVDIEDSPHATTHSLTGGIYGCDLMTPMLEAGYIVDETAQKEICSKWVFYMKEFYRASFLTPNKDCEVDDEVQNSKCSFTCATEKESQLKLDLELKIGAFTGEIGDEGWTAWKDFVCTGDGAKIFSGDHLESASPADPSFWVIHPTLDRLLQAKFMAGGFDDETWATDPVNDYVCAKSQCYETGYDSKDYYSECCYGHYEDDAMLDFVSGNRSAHTGWTNGRVVKAIDPRSSGEYSMGYIYDSFSWNHCSSLSSEYDFDKLITSMYEGDTQPSKPTEEPTEAPMLDLPTHKPTHKPSHEPTHKPSFHPTVTGYTHRPTHSPDYIKPTNHPTVEVSPLPFAPPCPRRPAPAALPRLAARNDHF